MICVCANGNERACVKIFVRRRVFCAHLCVYIQYEYICAYARVSVRAYRGEHGVRGTFCALGTHGQEHSTGRKKLNRPHERQHAEGSIV
jgi:hypothetical protein